MVDLALVNGKVWTGDPGRPWAEAVAVRGDKIFAVGTTEEVRKLAPAGTKLVDLDGSLILPGFIDSHTHFLAGGFALKSIQLRDARGREEFVDRIAAKARELGPGRWVLNGDWDHQQFSPVELPRKDWIDAVTPDNPVCVNRLDGHMILVNSLALKLAGVTKTTPVPPGGEIVKDTGTGEPTGIFKDTAMDLVYAKIPEPSFVEKLEAAEASLRHAAENGVTSVHEMADAASFEVFEELARRNLLTARVHVYVPITEVETLARLKLKSPFGSPYLKLAGLKGFMDGSLGSATAYFFEPYTDDSKTSGLLHGQMFPEGVMEKRILEADRAGLQLAIHAIGDRANSMLLDMYERTVAVNGPRDRRWRVEHAQHLRPADIARFGRLGLVAAVQPYHLIDDGRWAEGKIGPERARTTYAFRSLRQAGAILAFGSDWTVAPLSPILGIYAAVTRRTLDGKRPGGWVPEEKVSVEEAVRAFTVNGAWVEFAESAKGTIEAGKLADLVVLDRDIFTIPPGEIDGAKVRMTVFDGKIVYGKD
ncbi:MAG: amidohydrolase [Candidatus Aminicenantes bacterium RBG_16_63_14]|nr:MAG: amidohydrolase [Candidatus Aminicenantes bacterium RBG_16_63_14]